MKDSLKWNRSRKQTTYAPWGVEQLKQDENGKRQQIDPWETVKMGENVISHLAPMPI